MLGADAALAVPDTRAERTVNQVISPQAYDMLFQRCARRAAVLLLAWGQCGRGALGMQPGIRGSTQHKLSIPQSLAKKISALHPIMPPAGRAGWRRCRTRCGTWCSC